MAKAGMREAVITLVNVATFNEELPDNNSGRPITLIQVSEKAHESSCTQEELSTNWAVEM